MVMAVRAFLVFLVVLIPVAAMAGEFDNGAYARVLERFVGDDGLVDYAALAEDRTDLDAATMAIATIDSAAWAGLDEDQRLAWWINAYNTLTLRLIVNHYPITPITEEFPPSSIRQIYGAWSIMKWAVMGLEMDLDEMEHEVMRVQFDEPRIHMALVCAAVACPPLRREPYTGARLDAQLEAQSRIFVTDPRNLRIDRAERVLRLSAIFDWFGGDFVNAYDTGAPPLDDARDRAVVAFVSRFLPEEDVAWLAAGDYRILYFEYDWNLNDRTR